MKSFLETLEGNKKEYAFTVKLACDEVEDRVLDSIEQCLARYELVSASKFKKSPLQKNPLDFPRVNNTEVYTSEIVTNYPCTSDLLQTNIANAIDLPIHCVVVYTENDPRAAYNEENASDGEYVAKMGTAVEDNEVEDASELGGQAQANASVDNAIELRKDRKVTHVYNDLSIKSDVPDASFEKADREAGNVESVFFGRNKER